MNEPAAVAAGPLLLGIDIGSSGSKAALVDAATGAEVRTVAEGGPFVTYGHRTEATVDGLALVVRRLLGRLGDDRRRVLAVGITGVAESGAPLDAGGRALAPVIAWHDRRGESVAARVTDSFGADLDRAIGWRLRSVATVAKLGWLVEHWLSAAPARWLGMPELVLRSLTGAEATEWSLAVRTGCFDIARRTWLPDVARAAGFDVEVFPPMMAAGEVMGRVTAEASAWSGLPVGTPATVAGHDHLVGFVGCDAGANDLADSVGTAEVVVGRSATLPDIDAALAGGLATTIFPGGHGWAVMTSAARTGQAVEAAVMSLGRTPDELDRLLTGGSAAAEPTAGRSTAGAGGSSAGGSTAGGARVAPLDAPGLLDSLRRRQPPALPDGTPAEVWATLLDALASETAAAVDRVTGLLGPRRRLVVFGGGSVSDPLLAAKARRIAIPVARAPVVGAVARGAALLAGMAAGVPPDPSNR